VQIRLLVAIKASASSAVSTATVQDVARSFNKLVVMATPASIRPLRHHGNLAPTWQLPHTTPTTGSLTVEPLTTSPPT
uniref:Uncharacterized protein n=1 Tax=Brassica oleracea var. oleracea TaxID=109376 RepID=A0A0D3AH03_BRAOL